MVCIAGRLVIVIALCFAFGLQLVALQSLAWGSMVVTNVRQHSFCDAVKRALDGSHPCDLCKRLGKATETEKKQQRSFEDATTDLICTIRRINLLPRIDSFDYPVLAFTPSNISQQPLSPPPRGERA